MGAAVRDSEQLTEVDRQPRRVDAGDGSPYEYGMSLAKNHLCLYQPMCPMHKGNPSWAESNWGTLTAGGGLYSSSKYLFAPTDLCRTLEPYRKNI